MGNNKTSSLFIIGNGFDISHSLKTKYNDFKKYLIKKFKIKDPDLGIFDYVDLPSIDSKTLEYNEEEIVMLVIDIINKVEGKKWSDLEKNLMNQKILAKFISEMMKNHNLFLHF